MNLSHNGSISDVIYSVPVCRAIAQEVGAQVGLYLKTSNGMSEEEARFIVPLLEIQDCFREVVVADRAARTREQFRSIEWSLECDYDLTMFRKSGLPLQFISKPRAYFYAFSTCWDLGIPWLGLDLESVKEHRGIVVSRSLKRRNPEVSYAFLRQYSPLLFVGDEAEYEDIKKELPGITWAMYDNALEMAATLMGGTCLVSNQSFAFSLAEAYKLPRCLEVCPKSPNCTPVGPNAYDCWRQDFFERSVRRLVEDIKFC